MSFRQKMRSISERKMPQVETENVKKIEVLSFLMLFLLKHPRDSLISLTQSTTKEGAKHYFFDKNVAAFCFKNTLE